MTTRVTNFGAREPFQIDVLADFDTGAMLRNKARRRSCQHDVAALGGALMSLMIELPGANAERLDEIEPVLRGALAMLDSLRLDVSRHLSIGG